MSRDAERKRLLKNFGFILRVYDEDVREGVTKQIDEELIRLRKHFERVRLGLETKVIPDFLYK